MSGITLDNNALPLGSLMTIPPQKMNWWYEALLDYMLLNPDQKLNQIAAHFKRQPQTIYNIVNSDIFKAKLAERRCLVREGIHTQLEDLAGTALGKLEHKLKTTPNLGVTPIRETAEMALQALGFISKGANAPGANVQINIGAVDKQALADAREAYKTIQNGQAVAEQLTAPEEEPELALSAPS